MLCLKLLVAAEVKTIVAGTTGDNECLAAALRYGAYAVINVGEQDLATAVKELTKGRGADVALECAGVAASVRGCLESLRPMGHYTQVAICGKEGERYTGVGKPKRPGWTRPPPNAPLFKKDTEGYGAVIALDPKTGDKKWEFKMVDYTDAGVLTTASDLVFSGGKEAMSLRSTRVTGKSLLKAGMGGTVASGPMTYSVNGPQYVAVCAGSSLYVFGLPDLKASK